MQIFCSRVYTKLAFVIFINLTTFFKATTTAAQTNIPYSRVGIGDLLSQENIANRGMGGVSNADHVNRNINYINPASYSNIGITTIQFGLLGENNRVTTKDSNNKTGGLNIAYINLCFPFASKKMGLSFGLMPETRVSYKALGTNIAFDSTLLYKAYNGDGGIQKVYAGYGFAYKGFSLGANANFLFGNYSHASSNRFVDSTNNFAAEFGEYFSANGVNFNIGALYKKEFSKDFYLNTGLTFKPQSSLNVSKSSFNRTFYGDGTSAADTIKKVENEKSKITIPMEYGIGILFGKNDKWKIGLDYNAANWANYKYGSEVDSTANTYLIKLGFAYRPSNLIATNIWRKSEYRVGLFTGSDYQKIYNTQIKKTAATFGIGLPMNKKGLNYGAINAAVQIGVRGTIDNGLMRENFTRFTIGVSLNEIMFRKQRYD
jgi:hypothetical protein